MKRILKTKMKTTIIKEEEIKLILESFLDAILNGNFSETCFINFNSCFLDLLNYNTFQQNRIYLFLINYTKLDLMNIKI